MKQRKAVAFGVLLISLIISAGTALADDNEDPANYVPDGAGTLFSVPDLADGQDPTLFEAYPDSHWGFIFVGRGATHVVDNGVGNILNAVNNSLFALNRSVTRAAIGLQWQLANFDADTLIGERISGTVGAIAGTLVDWMLPTALAIGGVIILARLSSGTGEALRQLLTVAVIGVAAVSLAIDPGAWTNRLAGLHKVGQDASNAATIAATDQVATPFEGPTPTWGSDDAVTAQRSMGDAIWRTYVATPWCVAEFGTLAACQRWGNDVVSRTPEQQETFLDGGDFKKDIGGQEGDKSAAWRMTVGEEGGTRLAIVAMATISAILFCGLVIFLCASVIIYLILSLLLLIVGPVFLMLAVIPGRPRQWGIEWVTRLLTATVMSFFAQLVLIATTTVAMTVMTLTGTMGWGVCTLLTLISALASLVLFRHVRDILGVRSTGVFGTAMSLGFGGMMAGRNIRRVASTATRAARHGAGYAARGLGRVSAMRRPLNPPSTPPTVSVAEARHVNRPATQVAYRARPQLPPGTGPTGGPSKTPDPPGMPPAPIPAGIASAEPKLLPVKASGPTVISDAPIRTVRRLGSNPPIVRPYDPGIRPISPNMPHRPTRQLITPTRATTHPTQTTSTPLRADGSHQTAIVQRRPDRAPDRALPKGHDDRDGGRIAQEPIIIDVPPMIGPGHE